MTVQLCLSGQLQAACSNEIDANGVTYTFENININDVVRIGAENGAGAEYRITGKEGLGVFLVDYLTSLQTTDQATQKMSC